MAGRFEALPGGGAAVALDEVEISILRSLAVQGRERAIRRRKFIGEIDELKTLVISAHQNDLRNVQRGDRLRALCDTQHAVFPLEGVHEVAQEHERVRTMRDDGVIQKSVKAAALMEVGRHENPDALGAPMAIR